MKDKKPASNGFTLIEMLVVIAIVVLLASLLMPAVNGALMRAKQTKCFSNLRNFGIAWNSRYLEVMASPRIAESEAVYPWLSSMVPDVIGDPKMFICPADTSNGLHGSKPDTADYHQEDSAKNDFPETDDVDNHPDVDRCSYMYEFCDTECDWWSGYVLGPGGAVATQSTIDKNSDGTTTWAEVKFTQLKYGDTASKSAYDPTQFPLVRCFHHYRDRPLRYKDLKNNTIETSVRVLNVAVAGNTFLSGLQWEYPLSD